jgi:hypothetical protein
VSSATDITVAAEIIDGSKGPDRALCRLAPNRSWRLFRRFETAREAGATNPKQLGEQLALLLDGASARNRVLDNESFATAAATAAVLIDNAIPAAARR